MRFCIFEREIDVLTFITFGLKKNGRLREHVKPFRRHALVYDEFYFIRTSGHRRINALFR